VSCTFALAQPAEDASKVLVKVDGKQLNLNDPNGWALSGDKRKVNVQGDACELLQSGGDHTLSVQVLCEYVEPV
jgi:hypothetical protein